jgi:uncharacterized membrane protein
MKYIMKNRLSHFVAMLLIIILSGLAACRPSSEERRNLEIQDSLRQAQENIRLEEERRDLIERANRMLESREQENDQDAVDATDDKR